MNKQYNQDYYRTRYVAPWFMRFRISQLYYLWTAYFCLIRVLKLKKGDKVLDFGCGVGNLVEILRFFGILSFGVDPSTASRNYSRSPNWCVYQSLWKCNFQDKSFDLVFSNEVLEHISKKELKKYLNELYRISKGKMIHIVCTKERGDIIYSDKTHITLETEDWWRKTFESYGYTVTVGNPFYFFPNIFAKGLNIKSVRKGYFLLSK